MAYFVKCVFNKHSGVRSSYSTQPFIFLLTSNINIFLIHFSSILYIFVLHGFSPLSQNVFRSRQIKTGRQIKSGTGITVINKKFSTLFCNINIFAQLPVFPLKTILKYMGFVLFFWWENC